MHASCAARRGLGVLVVGPSGAGKSSLVIRLIRSGFLLVADDRVIVEQGVAYGPACLAGLIEVRNVGIMRLPFQVAARLTLVIRLGQSDRFPEPLHDHAIGLPALALSEQTSLDADAVNLAIIAAHQKTRLAAGAFF